MAKKITSYHLVYRGSAKNKRRADKNSIIFEFLNTYSVFDVGRAPDLIPGKGKAICACAVQSFKIAEMLGVPTHFIEQVTDNAIRVKEANIITHGPLTLEDKNYVIPAEWIHREVVAGSIHRAFMSGKKKPENYKLPAGIIPKEGTPFPCPVEHMTTKFEKEDKDITPEEARRMCGLSVEEKNQIWIIIHRLVGGISLKMYLAGFLLFDGKLEFIMGPKRQIMVGDVFGTPDEDRPVLISALKEEKIEHYSKEYIRQLHIASGYYAKLQETRRAKKATPPIPHLEKKQIKEISRRYIAFTEAYTAYFCKVVRF